MGCSFISRWKALYIWHIFFRKTVYEFAEKGRSWSERKWELTLSQGSGLNPSPLHIYTNLYQPTRDVTSLLNSTWVRQWTLSVDRPGSLVSPAQGRWWYVLRHNLFRGALEIMRLGNGTWRSPKEKVPNLLRLPSAESLHQTALPGIRESEREPRAWRRGKGGE